MLTVGPVDGAGRLAWVVEEAQVKALALHPDRGHPLLGFLVPENVFDSRGIVPLDASARGDDAGGYGPEIRRRDVELVAVRQEDPHSSGDGAEVVLVDQLVEQ